MELHRLLRENEEAADGTFLLAGTSDTPRLLWTLHFPSITSPQTPAVDSTLTDPPLPHPPLSVTTNPTFLSSLRLRSDLFSVSTPLNIDRLRTFLLPHPNQPLIESIPIGLVEGFWPGHFSAISRLANPPSHSSDEDLDFLRESAQDDREKGYLSAPFDKLLPGMHISPSFVVRPGRTRPRQVCDQSISGINEGVPDHWAKTTYDTIAELASLMQFRCRRGEDSHFHTLWKSDVSGGFRNIPVSPFWQLKQIHKIRFRNGLRSWSTSYFVDQ